MTKRVRTEAEGTRVQDEIPQEAYGTQPHGRRDTKVVTIIRLDRFKDGAWQKDPKPGSHDGDSQPIYAFVRALQLATRLEIDGGMRIRELQVSVKREDVENMIKGNPIRKEDEEQAKANFVSHLGRVFSQDRMTGDFVLEAQYVEKTEWGWTKPTIAEQEHKDFVSAMVSGMRFLDRANAKNQWFYYVKVTRREPTRDALAGFKFV